MMSKIIAGLLLVLIIMAGIAIYLFMNPGANANLASGDSTSPAYITANEFFGVLQAENTIVRTLYTTQIVADGQEQGINFSEDWRSETVEAGPLPALFLRETAAHLQSLAPDLTLFLGSDFPLEDSNRFIGVQADHFASLRESGEPQFFYVEDTQSYVSMFPDIAVDQACTSCHNEHANAVKTDWIINDIMGATTWLYPDDQIRLADAIHIIQLYRESVAVAYGNVLTEVQGFENAPRIGRQWPRDGYFLPSVEVFMTEVGRLASDQTLRNLNDAVEN